MLKHLRFQNEFIVLFTSKKILETREELKKKQHRVDLTGHKLFQNSSGHFENGVSEIVWSNSLWTKFHCANSRRNETLLFNQKRNCQENTEDGQSKRASERARADADTWNRITLALMPDNNIKAAVVSTSQNRFVHRTRTTIAFINLFALIQFFSIMVSIIQL